MLRGKSETQGIFKSPCATFRCLSSVFILAGVISSIGFWPHRAIAQSNQLGINLSGVAYFSSELPFVNIMSSTNEFITTVNYGTFDTGEEGDLCLDANGWPTSITNKLSGGTCTGTPTFDALFIVLNSGLPSPYYPSGKYDVYYEGSCTFGYQFDASVVSQSPGHDVFNVATATSNGIRMILTAEGSGANYCHNVTVTLSSQTANFLSGCGVFSGGPYTSSCFNPNLLTYLAPFGALRFMDWMCTNSNTNSAAGTWAGRPTPSMPFYGSSLQQPSIPCGVPVEVMVSLCNAVNADCWFNMPTLATSNYITKFAAYVAANLNSDLQVYVEYSNETWNGGFGQYDQLVTLGSALWGSTNCPSTSGSQQYACNRSYMGYETVTMCGLWKAAWGSASGRVNCVMGAQAAGTGSATYAFNCSLYAGAPCTAGIGYVAIAPYIFCDAGTPSSPGLPPSWLGQSDGGLTSLFTAIETGGNMAGYGCEPTGDVSLLTQSSNWELAYKSIASTYGVAIIGYESGQGFSSENYDPQFTNLFVAAQNDPRMGTAYINYYNTWKSNGGQLVMHYNDVSAYNKYGSWGALASIMDTSGSSPKYNALLSYLGVAQPPPPPPPPSPPPPTGPTITINSPASGATYKGYFNVNIAVSATDPKGIASITIAANSKILRTCTGTTSCSDTWRFRGTPGAYTITAKAIDSAGISGSASITITDLSALFELP